LKASKTKYEEHKAKERMRKRKVHSLSTLLSPQASSSPNNSFPSKQSFGKAKARAVRGLPKSPQKKTAVLSSLLSTLSLNSKTHVFNSARKQISLNSRRLSISVEVKQQVVSFLERPDISYCKPGRADTVYIGKDDNGQKV